MKKIISMFLVLLMAFPAFAEGIDLSGLSYAELVALKDRINLAMWECDEWQEVDVPEGLWVIGEDIPVGHWSITVPGKKSVTITYGNRLDGTGKQVSLNSSIFYYKIVKGPQNYLFSDGMTNTIDLELEYGCYLELNGGSVIFTPYTGKPDLGFK